MAGWRKTKEAMRRKVHETMRIPAMMYRGDAAPVLVYIRLHDVRETYHGDLAGTSANYAVMQDQNPTIVALLAEYRAERLDVLCVAANECYTVDNVHLPDFITQKSEVLVVPASKRAGYQPPPETA